jgi:O-antigen biosynthesis protein WbqP
VATSDITQVVKRLIDLFGAAIGLVLLWPVLVVLILLVRATSAGPGIFAQKRIGRYGRPFTCLKLRTMFVDTPSMPTHHASASQVTPFGGFLRRTKLDELPQLWNVLLGQMSFVGPRPCLPSQERLIEERQKRGVLQLRPGITGHAQIQGIDMADPVKLAETDAQYLQQASLLLDLNILFKTVFRAAGREDRIRS